MAVNDGWRMAFSSCIFATPQYFEILSSGSAIIHLCITEIKMLRLKLVLCVIIKSIKQQRSNKNTIQSQNGYEREQKTLK